MLSGKLKTIVTIQTITEGANELNEPTATPVTYATVWGEILSSRVAERLLGKSPIAETTIAIRIRYDSNITAQMKLSIDSVSYDIVALEPKDKRELFITVKKVANES